MGRTAACACTVLLLFCTTPLGAQFDAGQISGFVRDAGGLVVPGVSVTATNEGNLQRREVVSNADGYYVFPSLIVGTYTISAELSGFARSVTTGVRLSAAARISVNIALEVGGLTDSVEVMATAAMVENAVLGRTVTALQVEQMPLSGRNPVFLARLQAGVVGGRLSGFGGTSIGTGIDSISGGRANDVLITIDGAIGNRTRSTANTMLGAQHADTVEEIQVLTSNYSAEYGRASSGIVRMVTKSGTGEFHGTLTELFQNDALNANTWARNASGDPRLSKSALWKYNQYGGTLGGPIFIPGKFNSDRARLFFFWGEEQIRRREETTQTLTVPSLAMRRGDFSELLNPGNSFFGRSRVITDPRTGQPFPGNIIPLDRLSPQGRALLGVYPEPTPGFVQGTLNYIATFPAWQDQRKDTVRIDYRMTDRHSLAFRATHIPYTFNAVDVRYDELWSRPNRTAVVSLTSTLSSTFLNELTVSASSDGWGDQSFALPDPACGPRCQRSTYGVAYPFLFPAADKMDPEKLPTISVTGLSTLDMGPYPGTWRGYSDAVSNNMTKVVSSHTLKWGITIERSGQDDQIQATTANAPATNNQNGAFRFLDAGHPQATGLAMANVLLGNFNDYSEFGFKPNTPFVATMFDVFVQDSWKATPKLTLEAGVRYSLWPAWRSKLNTLSMFHPDFYDPARAAVVDRTGGFIVSGNRYNGIVTPGDAPLESALSQFPFLGNFTNLYHGLPPGFAETQKGVGVFQPRLGIAYSINDNTNVRAGVGKFVNRTGINRDLAQGGQPPFMEQFTVITGSADAPGGAQRRDFPFTISSQDPVLKHPMAFVGNMTVQRQLPANLSLEVSYVGRRGYNNQRKRNINQLQPGTVQANPGINPNALRPFRGLGIIGLAENSGRTRYDALQISGNRRMSAGLQFGVGYTFSRNLDDGSSETELLPNAYDTSSYWGISDLDRTHVLMVSYMYEPPSPTGRLARLLLGGWSFSGINQVQSGSPFSVRQNVDYAGVGPGSGNQFWNQVGDPNQVERTSFTNSAVWFNRAAFAAPATGTFGVQPRNGLRNPGFWEWNLSVRRRLPVVNQHTIDLRWDAFNVLNQPALGSANSNPASGSFGLVTSKAGNRTMQFILQYRF